MKKRILVPLALMTLVSFGATAQVNLSGGVKAAANMSNYVLKDIEGLDSKMKAGASLGGFLNVEFSDYFSLQPELQVDFKSSEFKDKATKEKSKMEYWGAELPIYAVGQLPFDCGSKLYIGAGPYLGLGFSLKDKDTDVKLYKDDLLKEFDFGAAFMLGYEFNFGLQINAGYKIGFIDLNDKMFDKGKVRTQTASLGLGYRF